MTDLFAISYCESHHSLTISFDHTFSPKWKNICVLPEYSKPLSKSKFDSNRETIRIAYPFIIFFQKNAKQ